MRSRRLEAVIRSVETVDGAGVRLRRAFGGQRLARLTDPFLLLDDFGSSNPEDYLAGFPWHPHRGFETVTYVIRGEVRHEDSTGASGVIRGGDLQWMTAGSGVFHSEMPRPALVGPEVEDPGLRGLQLWVNLPSTMKMIDPVYRNLRGKDVPSFELDGALVRLIAGRLSGVPGLGVVEGPVTSVSVSALDVLYAEAIVAPGQALRLGIPDGRTALVYVMEGSVRARGPLRSEEIRERSTGVFSREGDELEVVAGSEGARLIVLAGRPIEEPIAWYGPIVMNTQEELEQAFRELAEGTFVKKGANFEDVG